MLNGCPGLDYVLCLLTQKLQVTLLGGIIPDVIWLPRLLEAHS